MLINKTNWLFLFVASLLLFSCEEKTPPVKNQKPEALHPIFEWACDAENIDGKAFITNNVRFSSAIYRSNTHAYSGEWALLLNANQPYGMKISDTTAKAEDVYDIMVWRYGGDRGAITIHGEDQENYYTQLNIPIQKLKNGWQLIRKRIYLPTNFKGHTVHFSLANQSDSSVWFDDFKIIKHREAIFPEYESLDYVELIVPKEGIDKLIEKRADAFEKGVLVTDDDSWVKATFQADNKSFPATIRLKGDWLDHLHGPKWSFRVKLSKGAQWNGMRKFSLQTPASRGFLNEWLAHQLFEQHEILSTRYNFSGLRLNGKNLGIYAVEEHFTSLLPSKLNRSEGVILKVDESGVWEQTWRQLKSKERYTMPTIESAVIEPFEQKKTLKSKKLKRLFLKGRDMVHAIKMAREGAENNLQPIRTATFYALIDLTAGYHALGLQNLRWFINEDNNQLELIAYDCFSEHHTTTWKHKRYIGEFDTNTHVLKDLVTAQILLPFNNPDFSKHYYHSLLVFTSDEFLEKLEKDYANRLKKWEILLEREFSGYTFDLNAFLDRARELHQLLKDLPPKRKQSLHISYRESGFYRRQTSDCKHPVITEVSVKAYLINQQSVAMFNYHCAGLDIIGTRKSSEKVISKLNMPVHLPAYRYQDPQQFTTVKIPENTDFIVFRTNDGKTFEVPLIKWAPVLN